MGIGIGAVLIGAVTLAIGWHHRPAHAAGRATPSWPPLPHRVTVEVLNAGHVSGAGRVATEWLRQAGLDVVYLDNADSSELARVTRRLPDDDSVQRLAMRSVVVIRTADSTGAGRAAEVLGNVPIAAIADSTRLVDLTVLLGPRFSIHRPPP
jgi:LytR cell envelope-related transcriptional attenuator